ncbi:Glutathione S-transferase [Mycena indigotica]|uniref:Glutathione S-transferase n=1 Tax=Mycena indigotica TaxID=2126181 RepID=A0A8H6TG78_9AGAR|nr:Glutathione S-transferase [Mycena indigotica]KAF7316152.1 Glutathione S-transferase [Mycena indigotica]
MAAQETSHLTDLTKLQREADGSFKRVNSTFRNFIQKGGTFEPEEGRYHLYVSYACPWATRTLIARKLKGLETIISVTVVSPHLGKNGWPFANIDPFPGAEVDPLFNANYIKDIYLRADPNFSSRFTVPVLWDKKLNTIVNNESSEIIRIFNSAFNDLLPSEKATLDLYPESLRQQIDEVNDWVYTDINSMLKICQMAFTKGGFASSQAAYETAVIRLFEALDKVEVILSGRDFLVGDTLTEADIRLFVTIVRFDPAYVGQFKCNIRTIRGGYPAIDLWLRKLYWAKSFPAFKESTSFEHIKGGYYGAQPFINPTGIVPVGPLPHILPL